MSEDEDYLVENIIKVFVTTKREAKKLIPKPIKKEKCPKILVTDHSSNDFKDIVTLSLKENNNASSCTSIEDRPMENLKSGTEFESEPSDLMPDSFLSYLSSCKNLIGDISNYKEERLDADDWIGQFDQTITDAHNAAREAEEFERLQLLKIEERRKKLEQRRLMRKINKPLINPVPKLFGSYSTCHDKVCPLTLVQLKKSLKRYQPVLNIRFSNFDLDGLEKNLETTCKVIKMLNSLFTTFLERGTRKRDKTSYLYVKGICLVPPQKCNNGDEKTELVELDVMKEKKKGEIYFLEDILCIKCAVKEERLAKIISKEKPKLKWSYDKKEGILKNISKRKSIQKANKDNGKHNISKNNKSFYNKRHKENSLKKVIIAEQEKILKFMNRARYLFNDYEQLKTLPLKTKPKPKFIFKASFQVISLLYSLCKE